MNTFEFELKMAEEEPNTEEENLVERQHMEAERKLLQLIGSRRGKLGYLTKKRNEIDALITAGEDKENVLKQIDILERSFNEFKELQDTVQSLMKDEYEREADQADWFIPKYTSFSTFLEDVTKWAMSSEEVVLQEGEDLVVPEDSVSQTGRKAMSKAPSEYGSVTTRQPSNAQVVADWQRAEADCAALKAKSKALNEKLQLDIEEVRLKARKEKLEMETELAAAQAKAKTLRDSEERRSLIGAYPYDTPTEYKIPTTAQRPVKPPAQTPITPQRQTTHVQRSVPAADGNKQIADVLKRQTEITELLVKQQTLSLLPDRNVPIFDGDALEFRTFIKAFEQCVERHAASLADCLYYLQQYTKGQPRDLVSSFLHMDPNVGFKEAKRQLEKQFGNRHKIASAFMSKALNWPDIKPEDGNGLRSYAMFLNSCYHTMQDIDGLKELENSTNLRQLVSKLPYRMRDKWRGHVSALHDKDQQVTFKGLVDFIDKQCRAMLDPVFGDISSTVDAKRAPRTKQTVTSKSNARSSFATTVDHVPANNNDPPGHKQKTNKSAFNKPCLFCGKNHTFENCQLFARKQNNERIKFLKTNGMCFGCLEKGHMSKTCSNRMTCDKCSLSHPTVLHIHTGKPKDDGQADHALPATSALVCVGKDHLQDSESQCTLAIVPVKVKVVNSEQLVHTYAFLDPGSSSTFCTDSLKRKLNTCGKNCTILLRTMGQEKPVNSSVVTGLEVSSMEEHKFHKLPNVYTQPKLPVSKQHIPKQESVQKWSYLQEVKLPQLDAEIELLIGTNAAKLMEPWKVINSRGSGPYAVKTPLGWVLNGLMQESTCDLKGSHACAAVVNRVSVANLNELLVNQYHHDFPEKESEEKTEMSIADKQFMSIMEKSKEWKNGHYYLPLPLKEENVNMPKNYQQAQQRVISLKRKLEKNAEHHSEYTAFLQGVIESGYAEMVPDDELNKESGTVWFLPHHAVHHPKKGTLRVVFDCSASFQGTSLNSALIQGPNLTSNLVGVLMRFRQEPVALMADIASMFHQVRVAERHINLLRFLWWPNGDTSQPLRQYRMTVHIFGATSSPSCASFALRQTAEDFKDLFSVEAMETIKSNFYVDDCLKSVATENDAISLCKELETACAMGGFRLHKWICNNRNVLMSIPQADRAQQVKDLDLEKSELPVERSLGIQWHVEKDELTFSVSLKNQPCTRRGILSVIASVYDPLGFICPFVLTAKNILQDLCKQNHAWDKDLPAHHVQMWQEWLTGLRHIGELAVTRCMKPAHFGQVTSAQLHLFSDASESGYGCVSYLRLENANQEVHVSFVKGKSRVAPLKQMTIPRLELTAAMLAVRVDKLIRTELQLTLESSVFWTDSTAVLKYIRNDNKRYKTFVANRVHTIREMTEVKQWRHIETKLNPADCASRGCKAIALTQSTTWLSGPHFLRKQNSEWPKSDIDTQTCNDGDVEVKRDVVVMATTINQNPTHDFIHHHSNWNKLKRAVAWLLKLKDLLLSLSQKRKEMLTGISPTPEREDLLERKVKTVKKCMITQPVTLNDLKRAENAIIHYTQLEAFPEEMEALQRKNAHLSRKSHIRMLDPILQNGLLLTGGRLSRMAMPERQKHPVILPKDHHVSKVILRNIHEQLGHCGRNHMLARLRQQYWIPAANALARKIRSECVFCRRQHARLGEQKMADLPKERVTPDLPPFTYVGADYFGPIMVKRGRSEVKRYGVIFTCLTTRAVHLEIANSLDTDSCIHAIRRFVSRRGQVLQIRSDNGTNLISADRELRNAIKEWNKSHKLHIALQQKGIKWVYNPPAASHYGGVWERLIKQVKLALVALTKAQTLDDESLHTLLCEVEAIINSRPLTTISDSSDDLEPLTPNHLLLLKGQPTLSPGLFQKSDAYSRRRWKQVQYLADIFWKRWVREYLPTLQARQKWLRIKRNYMCGDVVLIADPTAPRASWMLGRIINTKKDSKGVVRSVTLKTKTSVLERPITKVCLLLENDVGINE